MFYQGTILSERMTAKLFDEEAESHGRVIANPETIVEQERSTIRE